MVSELGVCSESKYELDDVDQALERIPLKHQQCSLYNIVQKSRGGQTHVTKVVANLEMHIKAKLKLTYKEFLSEK